MAIPEAQLKTWTNQGPTEQFTNTYRSIKSVLEDNLSPYANRTFSVFLQGSYGNNTNIYGDSDVDIVICCSDAYYYDLDYLNQTERDAFNRTLTTGGLSSDSFRTEVLGWLQTSFPGSVTPGRKAIAISGIGSRRSADVLPCLTHKQYTRFVSHQDELHYEGLQFYTTAGEPIINFPKLHVEYCISKNQETNSYFKSIVRMFKNMRNRMVENRIIQEGIAPSYFIEGLLWNVPNNLFAVSYGDTFVNCFNWIDGADKTQLLCANQRRYLLRDNRPDCWPPANCTSFLSALRDFWNNWNK